MDRAKAVLSYGAGFGSNGDEGIFYEHAKKNFSGAALSRLQKEYPEYALINQEEGLYFRMYLEQFGRKPFDSHRPVVNRSLATI